MSNQNSVSDFVPSSPSTSPAPAVSPLPTPRKKRSAVPHESISSTAPIALDHATATAPAAGAPNRAAGFVSPPPKGVKLPPVPEDYVPAVPGEFANVAPWQTELSALPQALIDLTEFTDYGSTLGGTAPGYAVMRQSLGVAAQWSRVRQASSRWDGYASLQEGLAWKAVRQHMDSLRPAFTLAARLDPELAVKYAGLDKLLGARKAIAQKAAAARRANLKAIAKGELPVHGKAGKRRQRAAEKASFAAAAEKAAPAAAVVPVTRKEGTAPSPSAPPAAPAEPAPGGVTNGAAHA
jgi:hypothetical protein